MTDASPSYLQQFKNKARKWANDVVILHSTPATGTLAKEKARLLKFANTIKKSIEAVFGAIDELDNVGLGFLPLLVPAAVVAGSLAAIAKWTYDYKKFMAKIAEQKRLESTGLDPTAAAALVEKKMSSPFINIDFKAALPFAIVGGLLYFLRSR